MSMPKPSSDPTRQPEQERPAVPPPAEEDTARQREPERQDAIDGTPPVPPPPEKDTEDSPPV